jgi:hypothetical protein
MPQVSFKYPNKRVASLELPETSSNAPSTYLVGVKKGGSTLMAKVMRDLQPFADRPLFEYPSVAFKDGLPWFRTVDDIDGSLRCNGYIYGVFRWLPENDLFDLGTMDEETSKRKARFISLFRDPRDILTSLYFSDAKSHAIPASGPLREQMLKNREDLEQVGLDDYVLQKAPSYLRHYYRTLQVETMPDTTVLRYEDIIYDKKLLVSTMADGMSCDLPAGELDRIAAKHDQIPDAENQDRHIRQVHPGNFRKKLKPETIEKLTDTFAVILNKLNYDA